MKVCNICGENPVHHHGWTKNGHKTHRKYCLPCFNKKHYRPWTLHKKDKCEACGFIPEHSCQLDLDHIDGNHKNNNADNLQTLCANCHRLKTIVNNDYRKPNFDTEEDTPQLVLF